MLDSYLFLISSTTPSTYLIDQNGPFNVSLEYFLTIYFIPLLLALHQLSPVLNWTLAVPFVGQRRKNFILEHDINAERHTVMEYTNIKSILIQI